MQNNDATHSFDRRLFLGGSALAVLGLAHGELAQGAVSTTGAGPDGKTLAQVLAEYVAGFDLKSVPQAVIDQARIGFIDTLGVDPDDPDWELIGRDWVRPRRTDARARLYGKLIRRRTMGIKAA